MSKNCIFNSNKICSNCGECEVCELNSNKKCNNCGKCLELEGYDVKAIKIDEVFEDEESGTIESGTIETNFVEIDEIDTVNEDDKVNNETNEVPKSEDYDSLLETEELLNPNKEGFIPENDEIWEYIDDIDGVKELLENQEENSGLLHEEFPGLIRLKKNKV